MVATSAAAVAVPVRAPGRRSRVSRSAAAALCSALPPLPFGAVSAGPCVGLSASPSGRASTAVVKSVARGGESLAVEGTAIPAVGGPSWVVRAPRAAHAGQRSHAWILSSGQS